MTSITKASDENGEWEVRWTHSSPVSPEEEEERGRGEQVAPRASDAKPMKEESISSSDKKQSER